MPTKCFTLLPSKQYAWYMNVCFTALEYVHVHKFDGYYVRICIYMLTEREIWR